MKISQVEKRPELALAAAALLAKSLSVDAAKEQLSFARDWLKGKTTGDVDGLAQAIDSMWAKLGIDDDSLTNRYSAGSEPLLGFSAGHSGQDERGLAHESDSLEDTDLGGGAGDLGALHGGNPDLMNSIAWSKYEAGEDLNSALELAKLGYARSKNRFVAHTLCAILVRYRKQKCGELWRIYVHVFTVLADKIARPFSVVTGKGVENPV